MKQSMTVTVRTSGLASQKVQHTLEMVSLELVPCYGVMNNEGSS